MTVPCMVWMWWPLFFFFLFLKNLGCRCVYNFFKRFKDKSRWFTKQLDTRKMNKWLCMRRIVRLFKSSPLKKTNKKPQDAIGKKYSEKGAVIHFTPGTTDNIQVRWLPGGLMCTMTERVKGAVDSEQATAFCKIYEDQLRQIVICSHAYFAYVASSHARPTCRNWCIP